MVRASVVRFVLLASTAAVVVLLGGEAASAQEEPPTCAASSPGRLALNAGERTTLVFGRERGPKRLTLDFTVSGCRFADRDIEGVLAVKHQALVDDDDHELQGEYVVDGRVDAPDSVVVTYSLDPNDDSRPGSYSGDVVITDRRVGLTRVPVRTTLQYDRWGLLAATVFVPAVIIASVTLWWKGRLAGGQDDYWHWWGKIGNVVAILVGVAAARTAWEKSYLAVPDFGSDLWGTGFWGWPFISNDWLGLITVIVTSFLGAATAATIPGDIARGGVDKKGGPQSRPIET